MFKHNQMVIFFNNKKEDICDEKHKYLPQKGMGKVHFCPLIKDADWHLFIY